MTIQISATLSAEAASSLLNEFTPLRVPIGSDTRSDRWVRIERPDRVTFKSGKGLYIQTSATGQWTVATVPVAFTVRSIHLLLRPAIVEHATGARLVFRASVEMADFKNIPDMIDRTIRQRINEVLDAQGDKLGWSFGRTLSHTFLLPKMLAPVERFAMGVQNAQVRVENDAMHLSVTMPMHALRGGDPLPEL